MKILLPAASFHKIPWWAGIHCSVTHVTLTEHWQRQVVLWVLGSFMLVRVTGRPVTSLRHQERRRAFWEGPKFFELFPIVSNCIQHIFPGGGEKFSRGASPPLRSPWLRAWLLDNLSFVWNYPRIGTVHRIGLQIKCSMQTHCFTKHSIWY